MTKPLIIGIGNIFRGDDAIGVVIAKELKERLSQAAEVATCQGDVMQLMDLWEERNQVFLIDAISTDEQEIGFVHRFAAHKEAIPAVFSQASTHVLDVVQVIELAKALDRLPKILILYGIESEEYILDTQLSVKLRDALGNIAQEVESDVRSKIEQ